MHECLLTPNHALTQSLSNRRRQIRISKDVVWQVEWKNKRQKQGTSVVPRTRIKPAMEFIAIFGSLALLNKAMYQ